MRGPVKNMCVHICSPVHDGALTVSLFSALKFVNCSFLKLFNVIKTLRSILRSMLWLFANLDHELVSDAQTPATVFILAANVAIEETVSMKF